MSVVAFFADLLHANVSSTSLMPLPLVVSPNTIPWPPSVTSAAALLLAADLGPGFALTPCSPLVRGTGLASVMPPLVSFGCVPIDAKVRRAVPDAHDAAVFGFGLQVGACVGACVGAWVGACVGAWVGACVNVCRVCSTLLCRAWFGLPPVALVLPLPLPVRSAVPSQCAVPCQPWCL